MLREHCRRKLAGFKVPSELILRAEMPRNPSGKILKRVLRELIGSPGTG
jgi:fatty-acyl-CoA synthase